jgi:trimethylamine--corrinoid protein Co-methyltransferase
MNVATMDMKSTIVSYGSPEWSLSMAATTDLARFYNLPVWGFAGATDSKVVDAQAGLEAAISIMTAFFSRCTLVHDIGYIEYGSTSSMEMLVIVDEIIRMTRFLIEGIDVNEVTLAHDAIARVKPGRGFLADDHTLEYWKKAQWRPNLIDRNRYDEWVDQGNKDMFSRGNARAREILDEHQVPPLPEKAESAIKEVLAEREEVRGSED